MHCKALLFDLDGTLVTSLNFVEHSWARWAEMHGLCALEVRNFLHGKPAISTLRHFLPQASEAELHHQFLALEEYEATHTEGIEALPGASTFLTRLNELEIPWGIVTSGSMKVAAARIRQTGLPLPPVLITSENIIHGKPHPQPFLLGAERLGIQPEQCAAFEDSLAGLQSVWAAGCQAVEVKTAHSVPHNLGQIPALEDYCSIRISPRYDHFFLSFQ